jgi:UPF0755 protein
MRKKIGFVALVIGIVGAFVFREKLSILWNATSTTNNSKEVAFFIKEKTSLADLAKLLVEQKLVKREGAILALGNYKKLTEDHIALGKYVIRPHTSLRNLLNGFTINGRGNGNAEVEVDVVVPNVRFLSDLAGKLSQKTMVDSAAFVALLESEETLKKYGFSKEEFPAMFLPNTYKMYYDTDGQAILDRMAKEFKNYWTAERKAQLAEVGLKSPSEAVTLASIVYSEQSKRTEEWPIIAGLYLNRIRQGIPLQSDPTFKFCWGKELDTVQRLLNVHRNIQCPYNTYQIQGLPPGPICIPPIGVVTAVLNPNKNDYIFMCAEPSYSGLHNFAKDYSTHTINAGKFQRWLAAELAKK